MKPGIWNVCHIPDSTHMSLMPLWLGTQRQKEFWIEIGEWLDCVDEALEDRRAASGIDAEVGKSATEADFASLNSVPLATLVSVKA